MRAPDHANKVCGINGVPKNAFLDPLAPIQAGGGSRSYHPAPRFFREKGFLCATVYSCVIQH